MKKFIFILALTTAGNFILRAQVAQLYRANIVQADTIGEINLFDKVQYNKKVADFKTTQTSFDSLIRQIQERANTVLKEKEEFDIELLKKEVAKLKKEVEKKSNEEKSKAIKENEKKIAQETERKRIAKITDSINLIYIVRDAKVQINNAESAFKQTREQIYVIDKILGLIFNQDPEKRDEILKLHKQLFSLKEDSEKYKIDIERLTDTVSSYAKYYGNLGAYIKNLETENKHAKDSYDTLSIRTNRLMKFSEESELKWKKEKIDKKSNEQDIIGALPQIAIKNKVAPSITLLGAKEFKKLGLHKISIYAGNDNDFDTTMLAQLITPEVSKYGINFSGTYNLKSITNDSSYKSVFNYLINLNSKDIGILNQNFEFTQLNVKIGYENIVVDKVLSIYGSFNFNTPLSRKREFLMATNFANATQYYFDFGVKVLLGNEKANDFGFYLDLNFFNLTNDFKKLANTDDTVGLSNIKVGVQKTF